MEFNYTVKVENLSLNGGGSEESAETLVELGDYLDDFYKKLFGDPGQNDSMIYSKGSMDTMKMAGLSKFWNKEADFEICTINSAHWLTPDEGKSFYKNEAPWMITVTSKKALKNQKYCDGVFINRKFALSRRSCIADLQQYRKSIFILRNVLDTCHNSVNNNTFISVEKVHRYKELALLEVKEVNNNVWGIYQINYLTFALERHTII